jgi:MFS family permease
LSTSPHYRWYIVALTLVNQALVLGVLIYSYALFVVPWLAEFGIARSYAMLAIFSLQVVLGLASPLLGRMMDRFPMRWLVVCGAALIGLGLCLLSFATAFWQIIFLHLTLLPVGMALCGTLASQTMVGKWFTENRGLAIGISAAGTSIGGFIFPMVTNVLISSFDWQNALLILAGLTIAVMIPLNFLILRKEPPERDFTLADASTLDARAWTSGEILRSKNFWLPVIGLIPINAAFGGVQFNLGAYMDDLGHSQQFAAQLIAVMALSMIFGKFFFGSQGDRIDHRKLYWLMSGLLFVSLMIYTGAPGKPALCVAAGLQGFATGGVLPMMALMYSARFGTFSFGRVLGYVNMFLMIGSFGSIFSGWIYDWTPESVQP